MDGEPRSWSCSPRANATSRRSPTEIDQSVANTSHHLRALVRGGLLDTRRDGTRIYYRLSSDRVAELWAAMRAVAGERVAGLDRLAAAYLGERDGIELIDRDELAARLGRGEVVVLDVRPEPEFVAGHVAGARSVPLAELRRHLRTLPKGTEVVAYCRGRTASTPTTRSESSDDEGSPLGASRTATPNGSEPGSPSPGDQRHRAGTQRRSTRDVRDGRPIRR